MFPETFAEQEIQKHSRPGDLVFDPFCGRGTSVLQALLLGREAIAADINPVAYCITRAKAQTPSLEMVLDEVANFQREYEAHPRDDLEAARQALPGFFHRCFHHETLREVLFLRSMLNWRQDDVHCFVTALVLGSLHGEVGKPFEYLSNQMPRTISTKPAYSLRYWQEHKLWPKRRRVFSLLRRRAAYRLSTGLPPGRGEVAMVDARRSSEVFCKMAGQVALVLTSPPYINMTRYEEDQWLRLWFLGHKDHPTYGSVSRDDRYVEVSSYWQFLAEVWAGIARLLRHDAVIVCRLGAKGVRARELTSGLKRSLCAALPKARSIGQPQVSKIRGRQTDCFRPGAEGCTFEVDYTFRVS
jgi:hypothetical protein